MHPLEHQLRVFERQAFFFGELGHFLLGGFPASLHLPNFRAAQLHPEYLGCLRAQDYWKR